MSRATTTRVATPLLLILLAVFNASGQVSTPDPARTPAGQPTASVSPSPVPPEKAAPLGVKRFEKPPIIDGRLEDEA